MLSLNRINTLLSVLVKTFVFLLPVFFLPVTGIALETSKLILLEVFVLLALSLIIYRMYLTKEFLCLGFKKASFLFITPAIALVSAFFSKNTSANIFGYGYEASTALALSLFALVTFIFVSTVKTKEERFSLVSLSFISFALVAIYQLVLLVVPGNKLSFGVFTSPNLSMVGRMNDLAIFSALGLSLALYAYTSFKGAAKTLKISLLALTGVFGFLVIATNYFDIYIALFFLSLFLLHKTKTKSLFKNMFFYVALVSFSAACLFLVGGIKDEKGASTYPRINSVITYIPSKAGLLSGEVRPSIQATFSVADGVIKENPLLGFGSNSFVYGWQKFKPAGALASVYWDSNFLYGFSFATSLMAAMGVLGMIALIASYGYSVFIAIGKLRGFSEGEGRENLLTSLSFLFFVAFSFVYVPSITLLVFTSLALAFMYSASNVGSLRSLKSPLAQGIFGFVSLLLILSLSYSLFVTSKKALASTYFAKALMSVNEQKDLNKGEDNLRASIAFDKNDSVYRTLAELKTAQASVLIAEAASSSPKDAKGVPQISEEYKKKITSLLEDASLATTYAIEINPQNVVNYLFAARIAEYSGNNKDTEGFYKKVLEKDPVNPTAFLGLAKVSAAKGDATSTKEFITKALESKSNYTDALLAASDVSAAENDATSTVNFLAAAYNSNPSAIDILFRIANIKLALGDISGAVYAVELALSQKPDSLETRYALATLYAMQSKNKDAIELLKSIQKSSPESSSTLEGYITSLSAGVNPFIKSTGKATSTATSTSKEVTPTTKK